MVFISARIFVQKLELHSPTNFELTQLGSEFVVGLICLFNQPVILADHVQGQGKQTERFGLMCCHNRSRICN